MDPHRNGTSAPNGHRSDTHRAATRADVLVVDDLPEKLLVYRTILEELDVNLIAARSGQEALKAVLQHEFAVILLDVNMPGMDGFETATLIRQRKRSAATPIIFLTAFTDEMRMEQGYASGAVDYIPTPVVPGILRAKVQVFVELFEMRRASAMQAEERARRKAAEEAAERSAFLAAAGDALTRSLTTGSMARTVAGVAVPFLADVCVFLLAQDEGGAPAQVLCAWGDATDQGPQRVDGCPNAFLEGVLERALETEGFRLLAPLPADTGAPRAGMPDVAGGTAVVVPLGLRDRMLGSIAFVRTGPDPAYPPNDVAVAQELSARISIALENARLVLGIQEADQRKDEFLGMLAHELRNPLAPLRTAVHLLDLQEPRDELVAQARDVIDRQVTHMTRLVDDLLDATRIARGKVLLRNERCDLAAIVRQTTADHAPLFRAAGVHVVAEVPDRPVWTVGDPTRLAQVVGNLLHNAHKFTDAGGTVSVRMAADAEHARCRLSVSDTGVGIAPELLPFVFDVFRQAEQGLDRSRGGLGLGLSLVKGLVEMHGGTVSAHSAGAGRGTEFIVHLPLAHAEEGTSLAVAPLARVAVPRSLDIGPKDIGPAAWSI